MAEAGDAAAAAAVMAAHRQGRCTSSSMLDAMEAAEDSFQQQQQAAGGGPGATGMAADHTPQPDTPRKAAICEGTREKMVQTLFQSLQDNPRCEAGVRAAFAGACWSGCAGSAACPPSFLSATVWHVMPGMPVVWCRYGVEPSRSVMSLASEIEDALFASCHSKQVAHACSVQLHALLQGPRCTGRLHAPTRLDCTAPLRCTSTWSAMRCASREQCRTPWTCRAWPAASRAPWPRVRRCSRGPPCELCLWGWAGVPCADAERILLAPGRAGHTAGEPSPTAVGLHGFPVKTDLLP